MSAANQLQRTDEPEKTGDDAERIERGIERTRDDMSKTLGAIGSRLTREEIRARVDEGLDRVETRVKTLVGEELAEARVFVRTELEHAKETVKTELYNVKETVKEDVKDALVSAKDAARAATLGKVEDLATSIGDKMNDTRDTLVETVKNNPVPAAVMGVGLVWLLMSRSKQAGYRSRGMDRRGRYLSAEEEGWSTREIDREENGNGNGHAGLHSTVEGVRNAGQRVAEKIGDTVHDAGTVVSDAAGAAAHKTSEIAGRVARQTSETATELAHRATDAASNVAHQASDAAAYLGRNAKRGALRVEKGFEDTLQENPIVLGAAALAIGAAVGFALPRTRREDELMGQTRDRVLRRAGDAAHTAIERISEKTQQAAEDAKTAMREQTKHF